MIGDSIRSIARFSNKRIRVRISETETALFDSKGEALRFRFLKMKEDTGAIKNLKRQVVFHFTCDEFGLVCTYVADFVFELLDGRVVVEDFKSPATVTKQFQIKYLLMFHVKHIKIHIVTNTQAWPYGA